MSNLHSDLQSWLDTATADLAEHSKMRVVEDVVRHYEEVFEERLAAGDTDRDARWRALRSLGDPQKAQKRNRRIYLTNDDMANLDFYRGSNTQKMGDFASPLGAAIVTIGLPVCLILGFFLPEVFFHPIFAGSILLFAL
ncbi:MAG: hypothetical protein KC944_15685, partial [Candidatus Omnitrophica bacterium]|nr:hypothetical protein [Candidatus Omnitrophota bacterium]